jgi:hypothetical protein
VGALRSKPFCCFVVILGDRSVDRDLQLLRREPAIVPLHSTLMRQQLAIELGDGRLALRFAKSPTSALTARAAPACDRTPHKA